MSKHVWNIRINLDELNTFFASLYSDHDRMMGLHGLLLGLNGGKLPDEAPEPFKQGWHISSKWRREAESLREKKAMGGQQSVNTRKKKQGTAQPSRRHFEVSLGCLESIHPLYEGQKPPFVEDSSNTLQGVFKDSSKESPEESSNVSNNQIKTINSILDPTAPIALTKKTGRKVKTCPKRKKPESDPAVPFGEDLLKAFQEIKTLSPDRKTSYQLDGKTPIPYAKWPDLCARLQCLMADGLSIEICVECWQRHLEDWQQGNAWLKAPQSFFGNSPDAPWKAFYQAIVTERAFEAAEVRHGK